MIHPYDVVVKLQLTFPNVTKKEEFREVFDETYALVNDPKVVDMAKNHSKDEYFTYMGDMTENFIIPNVVLDLILENN